ncbi:cytochrome D ubiquinol oxidase subunit II [Chlamydia psittaci]|nr:decarboxylase family protein, putative [Chlamydia psittaci 6BC]AEG87515.1 putative lysine decarboxylase family protein [Chlamydia psittaci 02DC15]AEG88491.1 possible lysine decarboxylase family protein [Chlamydia psittaci 08DC60]AFS19566.1 putative lysine decarboxylase family protein [Chlamydia psittaci 84/55]AFS22757.1 putative lysine decarboxylase family protein [Chlamydia psittaci VS225]ATQ71558.1 Rossmann fold domain-containing protein [Chlamydia psittaci]EPL00414.1 putative lysine dec
MRFLYFYFTLLMCISPTFGSSQNWEPQDIHDCEQIISATQFHQDHGPWIVVAGGFCPTDEHYKKAQNIGYLLVKNGYAVVTGAGPGIMEAANAGAVRAGGASLGFILKGEELNDHIPKENYLQVSHISHRLEGMVGKASGCVVFPGGLGTVSECFFALDHFRYLEVPHPVVLVGMQFWGPLVEWMKNLHYTHTCPGHLYLVDSSEEAVDIIFSHHKRQSYSFSSN